MSVNSEESVNQSQDLELAYLEGSSRDHASTLTAASYSTPDEILNIGGLALRHFGHKIVPMTSQQEVSRARVGERSRPSRLRDAKDKATQGAKLVGPAPRYLHTHFKFIYYTCMIPYQRECMLECQGMSPTTYRLKRIFFYLQKVSERLCFSISMFQPAWKLVGSERFCFQALLC